MSHTLEAYTAKIKELSRELQVYEAKADEIKNAKFVSAFLDAIAHGWNVVPNRDGWFLRAPETFRCNQERWTSGTQESVVLFGNKIFYVKQWLFTDRIRRNE